MTDTERDTRSGRKISRSLIVFGIVGSPRRLFSQFSWLYCRLYVWVGEIRPDTDDWQNEEGGFSVHTESPGNVANGRDDNSGTVADRLTETSRIVHISYQFHQLLKRWVSENPLISNWSVYPGTERSEGGEAGE